LPNTVIVNWTTINHRRAYFDQLALALHFDPLEPDNWYSLPRSIMRTIKSHQVLHYYNGDYLTALMHVYPNIGLTKRTFTAWSYLKYTTNRNYSLQDVLGSTQHHPLIIENWRALYDIENLPMFDFYKDTLIDWLDENGAHKYPSTTEGWHTLSRQEAFFNEIAIRHSFDPLLPQNWYKLSRNVILSAKGGHSVLAQYRGSYVKALMCVYPSIGLEEQKFKNLLRNYWSHIDNRRIFFINFSKEKGFDPLVPENWYSHAWELYSTKHATSVLSHYQGSISKALSHTFPGLDMMRSVLVVPSNTPTKNGFSV